MGNVQRRLAMVVVVLAALVGAASAQAHPPAPIDEQGKAIGGKIHRWLHQARVPLVHGRVRLVRSACPGRPAFAGCIHVRQPRRIYLRTGLKNPRRILYHELGHLFDLFVMNNGDRRAFKRAIGIRRKGWFVGAVSPSEWFADAYAACAIRVRISHRPRPTPYGYRPTPKRHRNACHVIEQAAAPVGKPPKPPKDPPPVIDQEPPATPPKPAPPPKPEGNQPPPPPPCGVIEELLTGCRPAG